MSRSHADPDAGSLETIFHNRWTVPVVATLGTQGGGAKFITLQNTLEVSRDSLRRTLDVLLEANLVTANPGYGHPLRPEYVLTDLSRGLAPGCARLWEHLERGGLRTTGLKKWFLPVAYAISLGGSRFNRIREALPRATPRALASALRDLQDTGLAIRYLVDDDPPRTEYALTSKGKKLIPILSDLARAL